MHATLIYYHVLTPTPAGPPAAPEPPCEQPKEHPCQLTHVIALQALALK